MGKPAGSGPSSATATHAGCVIVVGTVLVSPFVFRVHSEGGQSHRYDHHLCFFLCLDSLPAHPGGTNPRGHPDAMGRRGTSVDAGMCSLCHQFASSSLAWAIIPFLVLQELMANQVSA